MKKIVYILLLIAVSSNAMADWRFFAENDDNVQYIDKTSIRKSGKKAKIWMLRDYKTPQIDEETKKSFQSEVVLFEFDCKDETFKAAHISAYANNMQSGEVIKNFDFSDKVFKPQVITPNTFASALFKTTCGR